LTCSWPPSCSFVDWARGGVMPSDGAKSGAGASRRRWNLDAANTTHTSDGQ
jgi:hypothetical protein